MPQICLAEGMNILMDNFDKNYNRILASLANISKTAATKFTIHPVCMTLAFKLKDLVRKKTMT